MPVEENSEEDVIEGDKRRLSEPSSKDDAPSTPRPGDEAVQPRPPYQRPRAQSLAFVRGLSETIKEVDEDASSSDSIEAPEAQSKDSTIATTPPVDPTMSPGVRRITPPFLHGLHEEDAKKKKLAAIDEYYGRHSDDIIRSEDYLIAIQNAQREINRRREGPRQRKVSSTGSNQEKAADKLTRSFYAVVSFHKKVGMRHFIMIALVATYAAIGGAIFYNIESPNEIETMNTRYVLLQKEFHRVSANFIKAARNGEPDLNKKLKDAYIKFLQIEERYSGSTYYKLEGEQNLLWTYGSAIFFTISVYTTIGYGVIACSTTLGRALTLLYAMVTVPLTYVVYRHLGQVCLIYITKFYGKLLIKIKEARGMPMMDTDAIRLPIKFAFISVCCYVMAVTTFVYNYDAHWGPNSMDYFSAFYFAFTTLPAIGLGDVLPVYAPCSPLVLFIFSFGMPFARVLNRVSYMAIENAIFGAITMLEQTLDSVKTTLSGPPLPTPSAKDAESGVGIPPSTRRQSVISETGSEISQEDEEMYIRNAHLLNNNLTITSIAAMIRSRQDVYGGDFGRVTVTKNDI